MNKKYWLILLILILAIGGITIFYKKSTKNSKIGNNRNSQEIVDYILNLSSYEVKITVDIISNKNNNKYIIIQKFQTPNISTQEVIEPSNIAGTKIINDGINLKIENSNLNLSTILENYTYLGNNCLDLSTFIEEYKTNKESNYKENENEIIMQTKSKLDNIYINTKKLYIDKKTQKLTKMEIQDNKQKNRINILYNEVKINN